MPARNISYCSIRSASGEPWTEKSAERDNERLHLFVPEHLDAVEWKDLDGNPVIKERKRESLMGGTQLKKIMDVVDLLSQPGGASIQEIQKTLGVSRRTVYNLLAIIEKLGFAPYDKKPLGEREKRWFVVNPKAVPLGHNHLEESLTPREYLALHLMQGISAPYLGEKLSQCTRKALEKLGALLFETPPCCGSSVERLQCLMLASDTLKKTYLGQEEIIQTLIRGILKQEVLQIMYRSFSKNRDISFPINPLQFFESQGGLYIFYESPIHKEFRLLAVDRILDALPTEDSFEWPAHFDGQALVENSFAMIWDDPVEVTLWISPEQAKYVKERNIVRQQRVEEREDGSLKIYLKTSGWWTIKQWVLSMGAHTAVLDPPHLRQEMRETLQEMQGRYSQEIR